MIGIDIGGANLKVVDDDGSHLHYCPLWKKTNIKEILQEYAGASDAAVVMSGEQADCFSSKIEGIEFIVSAVCDIFPDAKFYGTDGKFHSKPIPELGAANWLVMADILRTMYPDALLVDMGSTTTDLIPLNGFEDLKGQTDYSRLKQDLLLYYGLLRTPVFSLLRSIPLDSATIRISTEYFACAGDAHLVAGLINSDEYSTATPDNGDTDKISCLQRISRMVCADLSEIGEERAGIIAGCYIREEKREIEKAVRTISERYGCKRVITAGIGSRLLSRWLDAIDLRVKMGDISDAMPAWAVREAALRDV